MRRPVRGVSLVQVLVAAGLTAVIGTAMMQLMKGFSRNMASLSQKNETEEIRAMLQRRLSCSLTFPTGVCTPGPRGQVILKDTSGNDIFTDYDETNAATNPDKAVFRDSYRWASTMARVRATCGAQSLDIRIVSWMEPQKAWPNVAAIQVCQEVLGGPPPACPADDTPVRIDGVTRCVARAGLCQGMGFEWDGGNCYPPVESIYGGHYQTGENPVVHLPDCETANPYTGRCTCPPGFSPRNAGFTVEPSGMWDTNWICLRNGATPPGPVPPAGPPPTPSGPSGPTKGP